ncbi:MAG TPA: glycosyltransferase family 39 protein [Verrucomicrobiae bacterium]|nr:glycosyltransferase family 39 protein [Verrucomicrobiae bacterium]
MNRELIALFAFGCAFAALSVASYTRESATFDEPKHLTCGYVALKLHDYRLDNESPPFARLWAALPLMVTPGVKLNTNTPTWFSGDNNDFYKDFLYAQNNADQLLYRARFMIVLLGVLLGGLLFWWARALFGFGTAVCVLVLYTLEPNLMAHSGLVTTDLGFACFFFGSVYFLWRLTRDFGAGDLVGLTIFFAAAMLTKFSCLLLIPILVVLLTAYAAQSGQWRHALIALSVLLAGTYLLIHAVYAFCGADSVGPFLLPECYLDGIRGQLALQKNWTVFLDGKLSQHGWWVYYLVAFLIKTPMATLLLFAAGLILVFSKRRTLSLNEAFILVPLTLFFGGATVFRFNLGLRYILPIYPFVLLVAGQVCAQLLRDNHKWILATLAATLLGAFFCIYPHTLAFFNLLAGGPRGGSRILVDSNLDWGQDLKPLKHWMDDHHVHQIGLSYFGTADPAYYGIACTRLPGYPPTPPYPVPQLPGYVAISVTNLRGVPITALSRKFYEPFTRATPVATIGYSIYVFHVDRPWW